MYWMSASLIVERLRGKFCLFVSSKVSHSVHVSTITVEIVVDGNRVANVQADGLIMATPSGSTAYSMTAGGPMVAPSVPCTIITPLAPLSLSFRPLVIPETSEVIINVSPLSKSIARASFDGRQQARYNEVNMCVLLIQWLRTVSSITFSSWGSIPERLIENAELWRDRDFQLDQTERVWFLQTRHEILKNTSD